MRALRVHLDGLAGLETITQQSQFLASFRETLNLEDVSLSHSIEQKVKPRDQLQHNLLMIARAKLLIHGTLLMISINPEIT